MHLETETARPVCPPLIAWPLLTLELSPDARRSVRLTETTAEDLIEFWSEWEPGFHWSELAWDTRRLFGAERGRGIFHVLADAWDQPERADFIDECWAAANHPEPTQFDRLWVDAAESARRDDWQTHADIEPFFAGLEDEWAGHELTRREAAKSPQCPRKIFEEWMAEIIVQPDDVALPNLILSDAEFVANFVPPEYLLDGILQRQFCYSLTAATGAGKTAVALRLAAHVGLGRPLGDREVQRGSVLYFASENAVDVQARWIAMAEHCGFEIGKTSVQFVSGASRLSEIADRITREAEANERDLALVIIDTSAATFEGADENSNVDAITHAKRMRSLTQLHGGPTVLVLTHPTKKAGADDLTPRGGGAFIAEIDGNLCARNQDGAVEIHWTGKFRGPDFAPMLFELRTVAARLLIDRRGRNIPTVLAEPLSEAGRQARVVAGRRDEDIVLGAVEKHPGASSSDLAKAIGWTMRDGRPYGVKVRRALERLATEGLIFKHRGAWTLAPKGQKELNANKRNYPLTGVGTATVPTLPPLPPFPGR